MGIFDKAKDLIAKNADKVSQGIDKAGDALDSKTGGQHTGHVDQAQAEAKRRLEELRTKDGSAGPSGTPATSNRPDSNPPSTPV